MPEGYGMIDLTGTERLARKASLTTMANIFRLLAEEDKLTDELFAFVIDSNADSRNELAIISVLHEINPQMVSVPACMILDAVEERHDVADHVHALLSGERSEEQLRIMKKK